MTKPSLDVRIMHRLAAGQVITSPKDLAMLFGVIPDTIRRRLNRLEHAGMITRDRANGPWRVSTPKAKR